MPDVLPFVVPGRSPEAVRRRWLMAAAVAVFFVAYMPVFLKDWQQREWITLFAESGQRLLAGETLYRFEDREMYAYLPGLAVLTLPLAVLTPQFSVIAWYVVAFGCVTGTVWASWRLTAGRGVEIKGCWALVLIATLVLAGRFLLSPLENHQFDAVIAALVLGGLVAWSAGKDVSGGLLLGLGAGLKGTPLLFAPYLIWRGQWKAAAVMLAAFAALNIAPDWIGPRASGRSHLEDCYDCIVLPARSKPPGMWLTGTPQQQLNQSLGATIHRFASFGLSAGNADAMRYAPEQADRVQVAISILSAALIGMTLWSGGRPGRGAAFRLPVPPIASDPPPVDPRLGLEAGMVVCLMLLLSPQSSKAHFAVLTLPVMQIVRAAAIDRSRVARVASIGLALLGPLSVKGIVGSAWGDRLLVWGAPTFFTLLTLATLWHLRRQAELPATRAVTEAAPLNPRVAA